MMSNLVHLGAFAFALMHTADRATASSEVRGNPFNSSDFSAAWISHCTNRDLVNVTVLIVSSVHSTLYTTLLYNMRPRCPYNFKGFPDTAGPSA